MRVLEIAGPRDPHRPAGSCGPYPRVIAHVLPFVLVAAVLLAPSASGADLLPTVRASILVGPPDYTLHLDLQPAPQIAGRRIGTFLQAVRAFGQAQVVSSVATQPACRASWPKLGLKIDFSTVRPGFCAARDLGLWLEVRAVANRWHTNAGLHVGDPARRLHTLYPQARRLDFLGQGPTWELETGGPLCDGGPPLALAARISAGRVAALTILHIPACG